MSNKVYGSLEELLKENRVFYNFSKLCEIPHPSFKEKQLSDFLLSWAEERKLFATQDHKWNVFIRKPATPGYENAPSVMLQAHIDMVCEKAAGVSHDFDKDPIHLELEGDLLTTGGRTTLGADDGIGVAYAMAILEADDIPHPPLEVLFTTAEEEDLSGAQEVDASDFKARMLINIDNAVEHELLAGSCGGMGTELLIPLEFGEAPSEYTAWEVKISGLPGGHSGEDINKGHGNANILLGRLLNSCQQKFSFMLGDIIGGSFRLAIPRDAACVLLLPADNVSELKETAAKLAQIFKREYEAVASELTVTVTEAGFTKKQAVLPESVKRLIAAILLSPNGISEMNNAVTGVVESSDNLGEICLEDGKAKLIYEIRASFDTTGTYIYEKIQTLAELLCGTCRSFADYPSWSFSPVSRLRQLTTKVYRREFNDEIKTMVVHCGLECGCLYPKMPGLDAISIGPDCWGLHSPQERLSISSSERMYQLIKGVLAEIRS